VRSAGTESAVWALEDCGSSSSFFVVEVVKVDRALDVSVVLDENLLRNTLMMSEMKDDK
jgi:hypothetical protein